MGNLIENQSKQLVLRDSLPEELEHLLRSHNIDWTGSLLGKCVAISAPVPVIVKGSSDYYALITAINQVEKALRPASPKEILYALAKLRLHYATSNMNEQELALLLEDYLNDLSPYPRDILEQACIE